MYRIHIYGVLMVFFSSRLSSGLFPLALGVILFLTGCKSLTGGTQNFFSSSRDHNVAPVLRVAGHETGRLDTVRFVAVSSEDLLNAEGHFNMVEDSASMDPARAHMVARQNVNTKSFKKKAELTAHFSPNAKSGEDGTSRVLSIARKDAGEEDLYAGYDVVAHNVMRPKTVLDQNKRETGQLEVLADLGVVIPGRKPSDAVRLAGIQPAAGYVALPAIVRDGLVVQPPSVPVERYAQRPDAGERLQIEAQSYYTHPQIRNVPPHDLDREENLPLYQVGDSGVPIPGRKPGGNVHAKTDARNIVSENQTVPSEATQILKIRTGKYKGNNRIVLESTEKPLYSAHIDDLRGVLQIKLDRAYWRTVPQDNFGASSLFGTYVAREQADGSVFLEVRLKHKTSLVGEMVLKPSQVRSEGMPLYRLVLDLEA